MATKKAAAKKAANTAGEIKNPANIETVKDCDLHLGSLTHKFPKGYSFSLNDDETAYTADETESISIPLLSEMEETQRELFV